MEATSEKIEIESLAHCRAEQEEKKNSKRCTVPPRKLTCWTQEWRCGRCVSFSDGWFSGSMLNFESVVRMFPRLEASYRDAAREKTKAPEVWLDTVVDPLKTPCMPVTFLTTTPGIQNEEKRYCTSGSTLNGDKVFNRISKHNLSNDRLGIPEFFSKSSQHRREMYIPNSCKFHSTPQNPGNRYHWLIRPVHLTNIYRFWTSIRIASWPTASYTFPAWHEGHSLKFSSCLMALAPAIWIPAV